MQMHARHANAKNVQNESSENANVKTAVLGITQMVTPQLENLTFSQNFKIVELISSRRQQRKFLK
jgi:hypothetical protein